MVAAHNGGDRIGKRHPLQNFRSHDGMHLHFFELFRRQASGLVDDLLGHREFADIVQERSRAQRLDLLLA